jgi:hypothetical protein
MAMLARRAEVEAVVRVPRQTVALAMMVPVAVTQTARPCRKPEAVERFCCDQPLHFE